MIFYILSVIVSTVAGSLYPAYASFKAINSRDPKRLTAWLMYWVVMGTFKLVEFILDTFVFWFPFYFEIKMLFVLWMILPQTQGSIYLYQAFVDPYLTEHEREIDETLSNVQKQAKAMGMQYIKQGLQMVQKLALDLYKKSLGQGDSTSSFATKDTMRGFTAANAAAAPPPTYESVTSSQPSGGSRHVSDQPPATSSTAPPPAQGYFSWAYNVVSPKLNAVATMASQTMSRQIPSRPLPQPPVNLYPTWSFTSSTSSSSSTHPSAANSREPSIAGGVVENVLGITGGATLSTTEREELDRLSSRLYKAAQSTSTDLAGGSGSSSPLVGSMRYRKVSLYEDENEGGTGVSL